MFPRVKLFTIDVTNAIILRARLVLNKFYISWNLFKRKIPRKRKILSALNLWRFSQRENDFAEISKNLTRYRSKNNFIKPPKFLDKTPKLITRMSKFFSSPCKKIFKIWCLVSEMRIKICWHFYNFSILK